MRTKNLLLSLFFVAIVSLFVGCVKDNSASQTQSNSFTLSEVATSTTSVTISWPVDTGNSSDYTIRVYTDSTLSTLAQEYSYSESSKDYHKFSVPFLNCTDTFYTVVVDSNNGKSTPLEVSLEKSIARRITLPAR